MFRVGNSFNSFRSYRSRRPFLSTVVSISFLPGQEAGNVDIVLDGGFGAFCKSPIGIADEVATWLENEPLLDELSRNAMKEGHPHAAADIVHEIGEATQRWIELNQEQKLTRKKRD